MFVKGLFEITANDMDQMLKSVDRGWGTAWESHPKDECFFFREIGLPKQMTFSWVVKWCSGDFKKRGIMFFFQAAILECYLLGVPAGGSSRRFSIVVSSKSAGFDTSVFGTIIWPIDESSFDKMGSKLAKEALSDFAAEFALQYRHTWPLLFSGARIGCPVPSQEILVVINAAAIQQWKSRDIASGLNIRYTTTLYHSFSTCFSFCFTR